MNFEYYQKILQKSKKFFLGTFNFSIMFSIDLKNLKGRPALDETLLHYSTSNSWCLEFTKIEVDFWDFCTNPTYITDWISPEYLRSWHYYKVIRGILRGSSQIWRRRRREEEASYGCVISIIETIMVHDMGQIHLAVFVGVVVGWYYIHRAIVLCAAMWGWPRLSRKFFCQHHGSKKHIV